MKAFSWAYTDLDTFYELDEALGRQDFQQINQILSQTESALRAAEQNSKTYIISENKTHYLMFIRPVIDPNDYMGSRSNFYYGVQARLSKLLGNPEFSGLDAGLTGGAFIQDIEADTVAFDGLFGTLGITLLLILGIVVLFFGVQRLFVGGLTAGAAKG